MYAPIIHKIHEQTLWLSAQRCIYWEDRQTLIVSDLHFGKTGHFRKSGVPVPQHIYKQDLQRLLDLLQFFKPKELLVVGDFFHSHENTELDWFRRWRNDFIEVDITLVKGNHDILKDSWYQQAEIRVIPDQLHSGPFIFIHEKCTDSLDSYTFCGHLHPGIILGGLAKQSLRFPCFYFTTSHAVLPAFSLFTGMATIHPKEGEKVFAIVENSLVELQ